MSKIRAGGVCSGIGGFELGLVRAGFEIAWMVEIDEFCQKVLRKHAPAYWPNVKILGDIRDVGKHNLESVDLLCGGIPCQPHSLAGKRGGATDDRDLWPEYRRLVTELRPAWVIIENVPGIIGTILDAVLSDLDDLGYEAAPVSLPAAAFDAPHIRQRVFILGHANGPEWGKGSKGYFPNRTDAGGQEKASRLEIPSQNGGTGILAYPNGDDQYGRAGNVQVGRFWRQETTEEDSISRGTEWQPEPAIRRVANGIPNRMDRLRGLGNALLPQAAEFFGRMIIELESAQACSPDRFMV